ncbi:MAG: hypothetical protein ACLP1X_12090 [Polyangiaceae bacterium]
MSATSVTDSALPRPLDALVVPDPPDHEVRVVAPVPPPWIAEYLAAHPVDVARAAEQAASPAARWWSEQLAAVLIALEPMFTAARAGAPRRRRRRLPQRRYRRRRPRRAVRAPGLPPPPAVMPGVLRIRGRAPQRSRAPRRSTRPATTTRTSTRPTPSSDGPPAAEDDPEHPHDAVRAPRDWGHPAPRPAVLAELRESCRPAGPDLALARRATRLVATIYERFRWAPPYEWMLARLRAPGRR